MKVGFIGLGLMGRGMAGNIQKAGFALAGPVRVRGRNRKRHAHNHYNTNYHRDLSHAGSSAVTGVIAGARAGVKNMARAPYTKAEAPRKMANTHITKASWWRPAKEPRAAPVRNVECRVLFRCEPAATVFQAADDFSQPAPCPAIMHRPEEAARCPSFPVKPGPRHNGGSSGVA